MHPQPQPLPPNIAYIRVVLEASWCQQLWCLPVLFSVFRVRPLSSCFLLYEIKKKKKHSILVKSLLFGYSYWSQKHVNQFSLYVQRRIIWEFLLVKREDPVVREKVKDKRNKREGQGKAKSQSRWKDGLIGNNGSGGLQWENGRIILHDWWKGDRVDVNVDVRMCCGGKSIFIVKPNAVISGKLSSLLGQRPSEM